MSLTINTDKDTLIGFGKDVLANMGKELWKFVKSKEGIALISGLLGGTGIGVTAATEKGRAAVSKAWTVVKTELAKIPKTKAMAWVKNVAKTCAVKLATGATAFGGAIVAGYISGLTLGDYFKGDAKNFFKQFGQDLALNLTLTPVASAVKHVVQNKDMVAEDIKNKVIKPIAKTLESIGQKIGIVNKDKNSDKVQEESKEVAQNVLNKVSFTGESNKISAYSGINYDEEAKSLGLGPRPANPQAENQWKKEVEKMSKKQEPKKFNAPKWYFQGYARKLLGTTLTWTGVKDQNVKYPVVAACAFKINLILAQDSSSKLHPQIISNTNIMWQALRGKNTGAFNYTEEDVYTYTMALASMIAVYRFTCKLVSLSNKRDPEISNLPIMLLAANYNSRLGTNTGKTNYLDIITNKSSYVTQLNAVAKDINTYALRYNTLISRWNYIADKCIKDYNGPKAIYGFYSLDNVVSLDTNTGKITYANIGAYTIAQLIAYLQGQLDALRTTNSGVYLKVAGDMIKLLGATKETFDNVPFITGNEVPSFDYDAEAFDQIRNAKLLPCYVASAPSYDRTTAGVISSKIEAPSGKPAITDSSFMLEASEYVMTSDRKVEFAPEENVQMTQFYFNLVTTSTTSQGFEVLVTDCTFTQMSHMSVVQYDNNGDPKTMNFCSIKTLYNGTDNAAIEVNGVADTLQGNPYALYTDWESITRQIDFMPRMQMAITKSGQSAFLSVSFDIDNYAYMTPTQFAQLNNVAVYSLTWTFNPEDVKIMGLIM